MRNTFFASTHRAPILLLSLLALSPRLLCDQKTSSAETVQLPEAPAPLASGSEPGTHFRLTYGILPSSSEQNQRRRESWIISFPDRTGYDRPSIHTNATMDQVTRMTFAATYAQAHHEASHGSNDLEYYGRHVPWAGSVILRVGQQAKAHPHVTTVIKAIHPRF